MGDTGKVQFSGEAYCGPPPVPETLWAQWQFDPVAATLVLLLLVIGRRLGPSRRRRIEPVSLGLLAFLFMSPLCALTVSLFSARVFHHVLLITLAAPLLALLLPRLPSVVSGAPMSLIVAVHAVVVWFWHAPAIYPAAIVSPVAYWTMQITLLGTGVLFWQRVLLAGRDPAAALMGLLAATVQMGMLGALLTLVRTPLYSPHFMTTEAFGLTALEDQQLGGLIMWVPASIPYLVAAGFVLKALLRGSDMRRPGTVGGQ